MTTIAAQQTAHGWIIAADGQTTSGERPFHSAYTPKIVTKGDYTFAVAGKGSACDTVVHEWTPPPSTPPFSGDAVVYQNMVKRVVPSLRLTFDLNGVTFADDESFQMIIAHRGLLAQIECDFTVLLCETGMYSIGSGAQYALGAMAAGAMPKQAVQIASRFDIWTSDQIDEVFQTGDPE